MIPPPVPKLPLNGFGVDCVDDWAEGKLNDAGRNNSPEWALNENTGFDWPVIKGPPPNGLDFAVIGVVDPSPNPLKPPKFVVSAEVVASSSISSSLVTAGTTTGDEPDAVFCPNENEFIGVGVCCMMVIDATLSPKLEVA